MKFNKLIPELIVSDLNKSLDFYCRVIGFSIVYERPGFTFISYEGSQIMLQQKNGEWETGNLEEPFGRGINFQIEVSNVDLLLNKFKKYKLNIYEDLSTKSYDVQGVGIKSKEFLVMDPDGYLLRFSQEII